MHLFCQNCQKQTPHTKTEPIKGFFTSYDTFECQCGASQMRLKEFKTSQEQLVFENDAPQIAAFNNMTKQSRANHDVSFDEQGFPFYKEW